MKTSESRRATVFMALPKSGLVVAGRIGFEPGVYPPLFRFRYAQDYLDRADAVPLDPVRIPLTLGRAEFNGSGSYPAALDASDVASRRANPLPNVFRDAAPDKWGRKLISVLSGQDWQSLNEFDVLTAVDSESRMGALRFGPDDSGPRSMATWADEGAFVRSEEDLALIARVIREVDALPDDDVADFRETLPPDPILRSVATSIVTVGGARPKALVRAQGGEWVAKFPKRGDPWNEPRIERATMTLAARCGLNVADTRLVSLEDADVLMVRRFDRDEQLRPRHMISGFTLLDLVEDGNWGSYQDLATDSRRLGADAGKEIFRRMVFNMMCSNIDDHPRNHAFFVEGLRGDLRMTPAFDIMPAPHPPGDLALGAGAQGSRRSFENALSRTAPFGFKSRREAEEVLCDMLDVTQDWREHYAAEGVSDRDIHRLERRFRLLNLPRPKGRGF